MELRNHPQMVFNGQRNWPPQWIAMFGGSGTPLKGEVGTLEQVRLSAINHSTCFLTVAYQGETYLGTLSLDDALFCRQISDLLRHHCGESLKDIGSLDVP